jgi:hypothetical protein
MHSLIILLAPSIYSVFVDAKVLCLFTLFLSLSLLYVNCTIAIYVNYSTFLNLIIRLINGLESVNHRNCPRRIIRALPSSRLFTYTYVGTHEAKTTIYIIMDDGQCGLCSRRRHREKYPAERTEIVYIRHRGEKLKKRDYRYTV